MRLHPPPDRQRLKPCGKTAQAEFITYQEHAPVWNGNIPEGVSETSLKLDFKGRFFPPTYPS